MGRKLHIASACLMALALFTLLPGCSSSGSSIPDVSAREKGPGRQSTAAPLSPSADGTVLYEDGSVSLDASNASEGYLMVKYQGSVSKIKVQITDPKGTLYTYSLSPGSYETFPLQGGSGAYEVDVLENVSGTMYALIFSEEISASINDEFKPFLYPNQYVWFTKDSKAVKLARQLSDESSSDLDYIERVYYYVIKNIVYDEQKALTVDAGYLPVIDNTLDEKKGICFDYASLMAAMLRAQSIPTKLAIGYSGDAYHAWISVYTKETGWVDKIIAFDGKSWALMDPTLAANNSSRSVGKYIGDGSNYTVKYYY